MIVHPSLIFPSEGKALDFFLKLGSPMMENWSYCVIGEPKVSHQKNTELYLLRRGFFFRWTMNQQQRQQQQNNYHLQMRQINKGCFMYFMWKKLIQKFRKSVWTKNSFLIIIIKHLRVLKYCHFLLFSFLNVLMVNTYDITQIFTMCHHFNVSSSNILFWQATRWRNYLSVQLIIFEVFIPEVRAVVLTGSSSLITLNNSHI